MHHLVDAVDCKERDENGDACVHKPAYRSNILVKNLRQRVKDEQAFIDGVLFVNSLLRLGRVRFLYFHCLWNMFHKLVI